MERLTRKFVVVVAAVLLVLCLWTSTGQAQYYRSEVVAPVYYPSYTYTPA